MNQDSNTNQNPDSVGVDQSIPQIQSEEKQVSGQISPEINTTPDVEKSQSTPPLQAENHKVSKEGGGKKKLIKIFGIFIFFIILLVVVAYIIYNFFIKGKYETQTDSQLTSVVDETTQQDNFETVNSENWSTYLNTVYGYTIDYPESWTTKTNMGEDAGEATINSNAFDIYDPESTTTYPIGVVTLQTLNQEPFYDDSWEATETTINNVPMNKYVSVLNENMSSQTYLISLDGENYLEIVFRYKEGDGNKEIFDLMINSFSLLVSSQSDNYTQTEETDVFEDDYEGDFGDL